MAIDPLKTAPASAEKSWHSPETNRLAKKLDALTQDPTPSKIDLAQTYTLVDLVDLEQRSNRTTRVAWQAAREAAIGVGLSQAEFYQHCRRNRTAPSQQLSRGWPLAPVKSRPLSYRGETSDGYSFVFYPSTSRGMWYRFDTRLSGVGIISEKTMNFLTQLVK
jgi:outer membrane protein TolC